MGRAPDFLTPQRRRFVELLAERRVPFLVVGGEAIRATGFDRLTKSWRGSGGPWRSRAGRRAPF
jgi:hypothetical protein